MAPDGSFTVTATTGMLGAFAVLHAPGAGALVDLDGFDPERRSVRAKLVGGTAGPLLLAAPAATRTAVGAPCAEGDPLWRTLPASEACMSQSVRPRRFVTTCARRDALRPYSH
ncbi:MAG: hypothetical protein AMXMBFR23_11180 [Chloroflexota bacterium]